MRLNHNIRLQIVAGAMRKLYYKNQKSVDQGALLAQDCYREALTKAQRNAAMVLAKLGWARPPSNRIAFNVAGQLVSFEYHAKHQAVVPLFVPKNYFTNDCIGKAIPSTGGTVRLVERVREWLGAVEDHDALCKRTTKTLETLIKSVSSTEALFRIWPEGKAFYTSPPLPDDPVKLPAVQMSALNEALGLPKAGET